MHSIRLRGPWELWLPGRQEPLRLEVPATQESLAVALASGDVPAAPPWRLVRRFGLPTGLEPGDRVQLVLLQPSHPLSLTFNDQPLGESDSLGEPLRLEITPRLLPRNELVLLLAGKASFPFPAAEVCLEITPAK